MADKIFVEGMYLEIPENAPEWVKGKLSINVLKLTQFLNDHQNKGGYVNIDLKIAKGGRPYCELNTWKPEHKEFKEEEKEQKDIPDNLNVASEVEYPEEKIEPEDIPF